MNIWNVKIADRIVDVLTGGGDEARALKAVKQFRRNPCEETADVALALLDGLNENKKIELRQAART